MRDQAPGDGSGSACGSSDLQWPGDAVRMPLVANLDLVGVVFVDETCEPFLNRPGGVLLEVVPEVVVLPFPVVEVARPSVNNADVIVRDSENQGDQAWRVMDRGGGIFTVIVEVVTGVTGGASLRRVALRAPPGPLS